MATEPTLPAPRRDPASSLDPGALAGLLSPAAPPTNPADLPRELGERYEVRGLLGEGGQGVVLAVRDRLLEREVAAKLPRRTSSGADEHLAREARLAAQLEHPSILPVYDLAEAPDGASLMVMRRAPGRSLEDVLSAGSRPRGVPAPGAAAGGLGGRAARLGVFLQLAGAIGYAHSRGVLHLDLKPANVRVGDYGEVFVMDWGLARRLTDAAAPVGGTPPYMAPELLDGLAPDERADVYSLGVILYRMLSGGRLPIEGDPADFHLYRQALAAGRAVSLAEREPGLDPDLAAVVDKACCFDRNRRYRKVRELVADLEAAMDGRPVSARRAAWPEVAAKWARRHARVLAFVAVAAGLVGVVLAFTWREQANQAAVERRRAADRRRALARIPFDKGQELFLRRPPDTEGARRLFDEAIRIDPDFADAWYARARSRSLPGEVDEALTDLARAAELDPSLIMARYHAGKIHMERRQDTEAAGREFAAMRLVDAENEYSLLGEAWLCTLRGRWDEALDFAERAERANPGLDEVRSLRGYVFSALKSPLRDPARAVTEYDAYLARCPDDVTALNNRGFDLAQLGRAAEAERDLNRALALDPNYVLALSIRWKLRFDRGDLPGALADLDRALELNPGHVKNRLDRGSVNERLGRLEQARADYGAAAAMDRGNSAPLRSLAMLEFQAGEMAAAGRLFDRVLEFEETETNQHLRRLRGYAAWYSGDLLAAEEAWRRGVAERPSGSRLYSALPLWRLLAVSGRRAEAGLMLAGIAADRREKPHLAAAARFCLGRAGPTEVLEAAESPAQFCEVYYYLGMAAAAAGSRPEASVWFQACRATGYPAYTEHTLAGMELGLLPAAAPRGAAAPGRE
ncbi:MAG TPA: tetratricopeptide repeat protein [Planctomycetota bacterium]|nr:tetratricopeptide repeat protein [Planctomycetota bacterium]